MRVTRHFLLGFYFFHLCATFNMRDIFVGNKAKGQISKRVFQENNKHAKFSAKTNIFYPLIRTRTCAYQGVKNVRFCGKFGVLCFLETPVLRFAFLSYYRRITNFFQMLNKAINGFSFQRSYFQGSYL